MKWQTKLMLVIVIIGASFEGIYFNDFKEAWNLTMVALIIMMVWYNERK